MGTYKSRQATALKVRAQLVQRFPSTFMPKGDDKVPLKIGIFDDLAPACPDIEVKHLRWAINDYCMGPKYLRSIVAGAQRVDLLGKSAGEVTAREQRHAEIDLMRINAPRFIRSQNDKLLAALRPFSAMAHELSERNWNADAVVVALDNPGKPHRILASDFFRVRAVLSATESEARQQSALSGDGKAARSIGP